MEIKSIYRTPEEWAGRYTVPEYHENKEISGDYNKDLAVKCENGTFVGKIDNDLNIKLWRGIPFAKIPARFERSVEPASSDKVYEAYYFGKSCLQHKDITEKASLYEQDDLNCLTLNITTGNNDTKNKPVLVYIHGGGWVSGGASDPNYDGGNFVYYNPDVILVAIQYRINFIGMINLGIKNEDGSYVFPDYGDKFKTSTNNGMLDQIQALRWLKKNIKAFGGDPDNITISGESAGCGSVYNLLTMVSDPNNHYINKEEQLFQKAIAMSGGFNQGIKLPDTEKLTRKFLEDHPNVKTIKDIQDMSKEDLFKWRSDNTLLANNCIIDGEVLPLDMYKTFNENIDPDIAVLTGATTNEFAYYKLALAPLIDTVPKYTFENICRSVYYLVTGKSRKFYDFVPTKEFIEARQEYIDALYADGFKTEDEMVIQFANDFTLQGFNYYFAKKQVKRGGKKVYTYAFDIPYNGHYADLKAAHAVDCFYTFGNFDGNAGTGTEAQVELSRKWQKILVNFCKTGNPSTEDIAWKPYCDSENTVIIGEEKFELVENWEKARYDAFEKMVDTNDKMKFITPWGYVFGNIDSFTEIEQQEFNDFVDILADYCSDPVAYQKAIDAKQLRQDLQDGKMFEPEFYEKLLALINA